MLALVSHEPHFALLREEVLFGNHKTQATSGPKKLLVKMDAFQYLHISILRDYFDMEYRDLELPFGYSLERIIDDLVFMCFFVGNDFVPHLPALDIGEGGLDFMLAQYKLLLPTLGVFSVRVHAVAHGRCMCVLFLLDCFGFLVSGLASTQLPISRVY